MYRNNIKETAKIGRNVLLTAILANRLGFKEYAIDCETNCLQTIQNLGNLSMAPVISLKTSALGNVGYSTSLKKTTTRELTKPIIKKTQVDLSSNPLYNKGNNKTIGNKK